MSVALWKVPWVLRLSPSPSKVLTLATADGGAAAGADIDGKMWSLPEGGALQADEGGCGSDMKRQAFRRNHTWGQEKLCCFIGTFGKVSI